MLGCLVASLTTRAGNVTTAAWDATRRPIATTTPGTDVAPGGLTTTNTYDANGQVLQVSQSADAPCCGPRPRPTP